MKTCPVCQKVLTDQAKFCYYCGASLLNDQPFAPEVAEPEEPAAPEVFEPEAPVAPEVVEPEEPAAPAPVEEPAPVETPEPEPAPAPIPTPVKEPEPAPRPAPQPVKTEPEAKQPIVLATDSRSLMTTAGYIFTTILFHIPVIGLIFMIVWGCGKTKNLSRKRFSLACLIMRLIGFIVLLCAAVFVLILFSGKFPILTKAFAEFFS
ncbi:MAG: zinc ribbon domain-containing protein [Clostridia bacterium]|nr:zinc ribbon domain-containing protein [Clostridia bacterium]